MRLRLCEFLLSEWREKAGAIKTRFSLVYVGMRGFLPKLSRSVLVGDVLTPNVSTFFTVVKNVLTIFLAYG